MPAKSGESTGAAAESGRNPRQGADARGGRVRRIHPHDENGMRKLANHALSTPARTERYQRVMEMLDETTAENWQVFWQQFIGQTLNEGRVHETEWSLFMNRVGEVAGPDAMAYFSTHAQNEFTFNRREVLDGWATADPQAAYDWLQNQPESERNAEFWQSVLDGAAARDSKLALKWLKEVPPQFADQAVRGTVGSLIQSEGMEGTIAELTAMAAEVPAGAPMPSYLQVFYRELQARTERMDWLAKSYPDIESHTPEMEGLTGIFESDEATEPLLPPLR